jgi:hypothetical protein
MHGIGELRMEEVQPPGEVAAGSVLLRVRAARGVGGHASQECR